MTAATAIGNLPAPGERVPRSWLGIYGAVGLPMSMFGYPLAIWLPAFYAGELGLSLAVVGTMIMFARLTDVVIDPVIGHWTDTTRSRWGRRKPFIAVGVPLLMIGAVLLFAPQRVGIEAASPLYLFAVVSLMFLGSSFISVPYSAWGAELSQEYHERTRITGWRETFALAGLVAAAAIPALAPGGGRGNPTPVLEMMTLVIVVLTPITVGLLLWRVPEPAIGYVRDVKLWTGLKHIARNGAMMRILAIHLITTVGEAFNAAVSLFFVRDRVGATNIGQLYFFYFAVAMIFVPLWPRIGRRIGKHGAFALCLGIATVVQAAQFLIGPGMVVEFAALLVIKAACFGGLQMLPIAMLADAVDLDRLKSGGSRAGSFFAISGMTQKLSTAFGAGIALNALAFFGFNPSGLSGANGEEQLYWVGFAYSIVPAAFYVSALILLWRYPLDEATQVRIRGLLDRRASRREAVR